MDYLDILGDSEQGLPATLRNFISLRQEMFVEKLGVEYREFESLPVLVCFHLLGFRSLFSVFRF